MATREEIQAEIAAAEQRLTELRIQLDHTPQSGAGATLSLSAAAPKTE